MSPDLVMDGERYDLLTASKQNKGQSLENMTQNQWLKRSCRPFRNILCLRETVLTYVEPTKMK